MPSETLPSESEVRNILTEVMQILGSHFGPGLARWAPLIADAREAARARRDVAARSADAIAAILPKLREAVRGFMCETWDAEEIAGVDAAISRVLAEWGQGGDAKVTEAKKRLLALEAGDVVAYRDGTGFTLWADIRTVCYELAAQPQATLSEEQVRHLAEAVHVEGQQRCAICFWPLAESADKGCVRGNCSMRGESGDFHRSQQRAKVNTIARVLLAALSPAQKEKP